MKKEILKLTGLTEAEFYKKFPTPDAFASAYPGYKKKLGGLTEAFPQIATADNFFSYGVPVPPTYYMHGGPTVYPQIQTDAQFFSPVYSNTNNAYAVGGSYMEAYPQAKRYPQGPVGGSAFYMMQDGGAPMEEPSKDQTFYTQKMNSFFDKLRQASYKNMMAGVMNTEEDTTAGMPQLSVGRYGGMPSFQPGGGVPTDMIYDTFDYEQVAGSAAGTGLDAYKIPRQEQIDMYYGRKENPDGIFEDYSTRYGFDIAKELKDYPGLMQQVVDSNFNSKQDPRYLLLVAAGAISPNFADRFNVNKGAGNLQRLWDQNKELVFQQYKDDPQAFTETVGDYRKMLYQNTDKKGFDLDYFKTLKTSKEKSDYLASLQVSDAFTKSWNPRVDKMTANALKRMINPQAAATQSTPAASPAAAAPAPSANNQTTIPAPGTPTTPLDGVNNQPAAANANGSNFIEPNRSAELFGDTGDPTTSYRTVTSADGQTFIVGPNNQLYSPFTGNQAAANTNQQQQRVNPYPYMNRDGYYVGTGLDNVANFLIPNNPRQSYRNIREMEGMGMGDLTPEERAAFLAGDANLSKLNIETRRAMQRGNRLKSLTAEFNMGPSKANNPAAVVLGPPPSSTSTNTTSTTNQNQSAAPGSTSTSSAATQPGATAANPAAPNSSATTSTQPGAPTTTTTASSGPSIDPNTGEYEMPSAIAARIEKEQKEAERKNLENYEKIKEMQIRQGKKPDAYDPNTNYDYGSKAASAQGTVDYTPPSQNATSTSAANAAVNTTTTSQAPSNANSMDAATAQKKASMQNPNVNQAYIDAQRAAASQQSAAPAPVYSWSDAGTTPTRPNAEGIYTMDYLGDERANNPAPVEIGMPLKTQTGPVVETNPNTGQTFRLGGPYVLPMYQGAVGPGQVMTDDPFGGSLAQVDVPNSFPDYSYDTGQNDDLDFESMVEAGLYEKPMETTDFSDKFKLGYKFGRKKKEGVNPYAPAIVRGIADFMNKSRENRKMDQYNTMMAAADKNFGVFDQDRGDYEKNTGLFKLDQMIPHAQQGGPMMYDVADLFFLTPYMLKNTRGRR